MRDTGGSRAREAGRATDNCVEVRITDVVTRVRDSKNPAAVLVIDLPALVAVLKSSS